MVRLTLLMVEMAVLVVVLAEVQDGLAVLEHLVREMLVVQII